MSTDPEESHIDWANRTLDSRKAKYSASVQPLQEGRSISGGVAPAPTTTKPPVVPAGQAPKKCEACKALKQKLEDTEGALEGAHTIIRQLRDAASREKEWA